MFRVSAAALLATSSLASPALAADARGRQRSSWPSCSDPIVVIGQRGGYGAKATSTATKTYTPIKDMPQAVTVISASQIEDQQLRSIADVLYFVPGASLAPAKAIATRSCCAATTRTADFFVDGIRDDVQYFRDFYNVDRIEVLKGPNAMIFGRGGGGGIVNRVTKRSSLGTLRELSRFRATARAASG